MAVRKNINAPGQLDRYVEAVKKLKQEPYNSGDFHGFHYDMYTQTHFDHIPEVHSTPAFLPWHRAFLMEFERDLQRVLGDSDFGLPYWDWTENSADPTGLNSLWVDKKLGGIDASGKVNSGPFTGAANWPIYSPRGTRDPFLRRSLSLSKDLLINGFSYCNKRIVDDVLNSTSYDQFRRAIESGPHNSSHVWVGGQMEDVEISVNDPAFWLHHANVDRIWAQWQQANPNMPVISPLDKAFGPSMIMPSTFDDMGALSVQDVINAAQGVYTYDQNYSVNLKAMIWHRGEFLVSPTSDDTYLKWQTFDTRQLIWSADTTGGGRSDTGPALAMLNGTLFGANKGTGDSNVWFTSFDPISETWRQEVRRESLTDSSPALATHIGLRDHSIRLFCVHRGSGDRNLWWAKYNPTSQSWEDDKSWEALTDEAPALADFNGKLFCMHKGAGDTDLWWSVFNDDSQSWTGDQAYGGRSDSNPALAVFRDQLFCVHRGTGDENLWWTTFDFDKNSWNTDKQFAEGNLSSKGPSLFVINNTLFCVHRGKSGTVFSDDQHLYWCYYNPSKQQWTKDVRVSQSDSEKSYSTPASAVFSKSSV